LFGLSCVYENTYLPYLYNPTKLQAAKHGKSKTKENELIQNKKEYIYVNAFLNIENAKAAV